MDDKLENSLEKLGFLQNEDLIRQIMEHVPHLPKLPLYDAENPMYERFTDRARKVMQLANQEAQRFNHEYVGTEHILLGLIKEGSGVAANVLKNLDVDLRKVRLEVEKIVQPGPEMHIMGKLPQTPRAKKVVEYAIEEARSFNHNYVGTEHLLLGLLREEEGIASQVLVNLGCKLAELRQETLDLLGHKPVEERAEAEWRLRGVVTTLKDDKARKTLDKIEKIVNVATDPMAALLEIKRLLDNERRESDGVPPSSGPEAPKPEVDQK